jgi:hypothetical protein
VQILPFMKTFTYTFSRFFKFIQCHTAISITLLIFCPPFTFKSQNLRISRSSSYYTYVFKISNEQLKSCYTNKYYFDNLEASLVNPLDSFLTDSGLKKELRPGAYLYVSAHDNYLHYELNTFISFDACLYNNKHDLCLFVYNKITGKPIENALIQIENKKINYDSASKNYNLRFSHKTGLLSVYVNDEAIFYSINRASSYNTFRRSVKIKTTAFFKKARLPFNRFYYRLRYSGPSQDISKTSYRYNYTPKYTGYIAFNKPKYLPNDTVKVKAFFLKGKSKTLNRDLKVFLCKKNYAENARQITWLKPLTKGAYSFNFVLGDSLQLNNFYTLFFLDKKNEIYIMGKDFYLEDYQLNETSYEFKSEKIEYNRGEPVTFYASGKDANNMNLLDARVSVKVKVKMIDTFISDSVFVPNILWVHEQKLDPIGETKITLPDSLLPEASLQILTEVVFNNSNNESHDTTLTLTYSGEREYLRSKLEGNFVKAELIINGKPAQGKGFLLKDKANGFTQKEEISFPYTETLDNTVKKYFFQKNRINAEYNPSKENSQVSCSTLRTIDSVFISISNPRHLPIEYSIYKNGREETETGSVFELDRKISDNSHNSYILYYHYLWCGEPVSENRNILLFKNNLHVEIDQPEKIFPGQKSQVKIKVTDVSNEPVAGVNITAGAINNQFGISSIPGVPYLGKSIRTMECSNSFSLSRRGFSGFKKLDEKWQKKMCLDTMPYYKFIYPDKGICYNYDTLKTNTAQVSAFIYKDGFQLPVYLVYIDYRPVYCYNSTNADEYTFTAFPGYHTITLRGYDKIYTLDSILLKQGYKLDLSMDAAHLPACVKVGNAENKFSAYEQDVIKNSTLYITKKYYDQDLVLWQDDKVCLFSQYGNYYSAKLCGFLRDSVNFYKDNNPPTTFLFEPGYEYTLSKGLIKMKQLFYSDDSHELPLSTSSKFLGLTVNVLPPRKPVQKYNSLRKFYTYNPRYTSEGNGAYSFNYTGDSTISLIRIANEKNEYARFTEGSTRDIYNLKPGNYTIVLVTQGHYYLTRKSVKIRGDGITFERFGDKNYQGVSENETELISAWDTLVTSQIYNTNEIGSSGRLGYNKYNGNTGGAIRVTITDTKTKEAIPFATVVIYQDQKQVAVGTADFDGIVVIKPLHSGRYTAKVVYIGYTVHQITDIVVMERKTVYLNVNLFNEGVDLNEVAITEYNVPLIDPDTKSGGTFSREEFQSMASKSLNSVVSSSAGVYQQDIGFDLYVRGSRSGATNVFIDGERAIGTANVPSQYAESIYIPGNINDEKVPDANQLRNKFADYAYWQPNLITDEKGEAIFDVNFPQNITSWKAYALAMDEKKHSGAAYKITRAYKNIMANLALPRFLIEGDSALAIGKMLNYTSAPVSIKSTAHVNDKILFEHDMLLTNSVIESVLISPTEKDSLKVSYLLNQANGEKDGEERSIPVFPIGTEEIAGGFYVLSGDTTLSIELKSGENKIYAIDNPIDFILKELDGLENYPYWCMEQTASKLNGLLVEKNIKKQLNEEFKKEKQIETLLRKLEKGQKENGSWGWWEDSPENVWMTSYVTGVITKATRQGYTFKNKEKALQYLAWNMHSAKGNELLTILNTLSEMKFAIPYEEYFKLVKKDSLSLYQKFIMAKICQENGLPYDLELIEKEKKQTMTGSYYWGDESYHWYNNNLNITLLVYKILENRNAAHPYLVSIRNYFLEMKKENKWRNTIETVSILETILPELLKHSGNKNTATIMEFSGAGTTKISNFPYSNSIKVNNEKLTVSKKGTGSVFLTVYQKKWNKNPEKKTDYYEIKTHYEVKNKITDSLKAGIPTELVVEVNVKKKGEYIMIEVPIPAGCSYDDNKYNINSFEAHREYFKQKTSIFCEYLPVGKHIFRIKLQPRFNGSYTVNPTTSELMYFPVFYGRNGIERVKIN